MAQITVYGNGLLFSVPTETSTDYFCGSTNGYFHGTQSQTEWTGTNLQYSNNADGTINVFPTAGSLDSFTVKDGAGNLQVSATGLNFVIPSGTSVGSMAQVMAKALNGNDNWVGTGANETFYYGLGNDSFSGGAGVDTLVVGLPSSNFSITTNSTGYTLSATVQGLNYSGQVSALADMERIQFSDKWIALDINGNAGQVYRLYQAAFNRKPDLTGLGWQIKAIDSGTSLLELSQNFMTSTEFKSLYGDNISTTTFVNLLYNNVLHRAPQQFETDFWVNIIDKGTPVHQTTAQVLVSFSESQENQAQVIGSIQKGFEYQHFA